MHLKKAVKKFFPPPELIDYSRVEYHGEAVSNLIISGLEGPKPFFISRFGSEELKTLKEYRLRNRDLFTRMIKYVKNHVRDWRTFNENGIFDKTLKYEKLDDIEHYYTTFVESIKQIDVLGSWLYWESIFDDDLKETKLVRLRDLEPYYHQESWFRTLENKRVLVVHPFKELILRQYEKKDKLFPPGHGMPEMNLEVLQALYFDHPKYNTWDKLMNYYKQEVVKFNFEVAIIGNGSWGMPLGAFIKKEMGLKAVHLGGSVQLLFGIMGSRWYRDYPFVRGLMNDHWVFPGKSETPEWAKSYDKNAYW